MKIEICVDNIESVMTANQLPIQRIELCSALSLGGITPNYGFIKQAIKHSHLPIALMIRPRAGDFIFSSEEVAIMVEDIEMARSFGIQHIVIGALTTSAEIDLNTTKTLIQTAQGMEITFHRAFDLCNNPFQALEQLIELGCHRILTSGQAVTAEQGIPLLQKLVQQADNRIQIMAGCGINANNVRTLIEQTQVPEIHFSAKGYRISPMLKNSQVAMGKNTEQDQRIDVLDRTQAEAILTKIKEIP